MTQVSHQTPPAGYPVAPVPVTGGVLASIPLPVQGAGPVPVPLHWCVLLNSSPYTLLVTQGGNLKQIAAFTADVVEVLNVNNQTPITVLPQPPSGSVVQTTDSTVYATWYGAEYPGGSYPAGLGSSVSDLFASSDIGSLNGVVVNAGTHATLATLVSTQGWGSIRIKATAVDPVVLRLSWYKDPAGAHFAGGRQVVLGSPSIATTANFATPHLGDYLTIEVWNFGAVNSLVDVGASNISGVLNTWAAFNAVGGVWTQTAAVAALGAPTEITMFPDVFCGPVNLMLSQPIAGGTTIRWEVDSVDETGALPPIWGIDPTASVRVALNGFRLPASSCRVVATATAGAVPVNLTATVTYGGEYGD